MAKFCENQTDCRRTQLLEYFGEKYDGMFLAKEETITELLSLMEQRYNLDYKRVSLRFIKYDKASETTKRFAQFVKRCRTFYFFNKYMSLQKVPYKSHTLLEKKNFQCKKLTFQINFKVLGIGHKCFNIFENNDYN